MKNMMYALLTISIISSCDFNAHDENNLINKISNKCARIDSCQFAMSDLIETKWDKMFIFKESASLEFINDVLGFNYPFFSDIAQRIIFIKGNSVVYHEDDFPSTEAPKDNKILFILPDTVKYAEFTQETARFFIQETMVANKKIYKISPVR